MIIIGKNLKSTIEVGTSLDLAGPWLFHIADDNRKRGNPTKSHLFPVMEQESLPKIFGTWAALSEKDYLRKMQRTDDHSRRNNQPPRTMIREEWAFCEQHRAIHYA